MSLGYAGLLPYVLQRCAGVCNVAKSKQEPTEFWLYTWTMQEVFNTPELITSLADYSERLISPNDSSEVQHQTQPQSGRNSSLLFLQVYAAADYFTLNQTLMVFPPPVLVDLSKWWRFEVRLTPNTLQSLIRICTMCSPNHCYR